MRRLVHVTVCLAVAVLGLAVAGPAPAETPAGAAVPPVRVTFGVSNPVEGGQVREVVGNHYRAACGATTAVFLMHGLSYHKEAWDWPGYSVAQALVAGGYDVLAVDRLGYGESRIDSGNDVSFEAYADMANQIVTALRDGYGYERVVMGGHSAGAGVTEYAQGLFGSADAILALGWHHRPSDELVEEFMTGDTVRSTQSDYEYFLGTPEYRAEMFYEPDADPAVVDADTRAANLTPSGEIQSIGKQPSRYAVGNVDVPVFLQFGTRDRLFEPQYGELHAAEFVNAPSVSVDMVPGAGHTFMLAPQGPAGTDRLVRWLRDRPETPPCA